jgi:hypothetical protein
MNTILHRFKVCLERKTDTQSVTLGLYREPKWTDFTCLAKARRTAVDGLSCWSIEYS